MDNQGARCQSVHWAEAKMRQLVVSLLHLIVDQLVV